MIKFFGIASVLAFMLALIALPIVAQEKEQPQMDPEMEAMMAEWMKYAAPGEHHAHLKPFAGQWQCTSKFRMSADGPWMDSTAKADIRWVLGDRFLLQEVKAPPMMGEEAFEGLGLLGYDNYGKKYVATWCDNMGTLIMHYEGTCDGTGKVITLTGKYADPMTKADKTSKWVYKIESPDKIIMEMHEPGKDGKEFMNAEITYARAGN